MDWGRRRLNKHVALAKKKEVLSAAPVSLCAHDYLRTGMLIGRTSPHRHTHTPYALRLANAYLKLT